MGKKEGNLILIGMVVGATLGVIGGYFFGDLFIEIKFLGTIFLNALKMVVVPLIVASMIVGVTSLGDVRKLGRTTAKTLLYYLATTGFAVIIGIILVNIIQPGSGAGIPTNEIPEMVSESGQVTFSDFIVNLIPSNLIAAAAKGSVLPLIIFSLLFGGVLTSIGSKGKPVIDFFVGFNAAIMKIVIIIIYFAPIGILSIIGAIIAENRDSLGEIASGLGWYALTVIIGLTLHAVIVLPLILKMFGRKKPFEYFLNMGQALATAFTTASSSASLPVTMECVSEKNKVSKKASSFVLPLGATINMDGTALYEAVAAIFIAQAYKIPLPIEAQILIFITATLASIGAAAIPHAGLVTMVIVLSAVGLPLEGIGFIFAIDWFLDRCRTTVNVWGDSVGAAVIDETAEIKTYLRPSVRSKSTTARRYDKPRQQRNDRPPRDRKQTDRDNKNNQSQDDRRSDRRQSNTRDRTSGAEGGRFDRSSVSENRVRPERRERTDRRDRYDRKERTDRPVRPERKERPERKPSAESDVSKIRASLNGKRKPERKKEYKPEPIVKRKSEITVKASAPEQKSDDDFFDVKFSSINFYSDVKDDNKKTDNTTSNKKPTVEENKVKPPVEPIKEEAPAVDLPAAATSAVEKEESTVEKPSAPTPPPAPPAEEKIEKPVVEEPPAPPVEEKIEKPTVEEPSAPTTPSAPPVEEKKEEPSGENMWGRPKKKRPSR